MAEYQTRTKKIEKGRYELSYGRGKKKIVAGIWLNDLAGEDGGWQVDKDAPGFDALRDQSPFKRKKDLVEAWGEWAKRQYHQDETPPAPPKRPGPPKHKPSLKEKGPPRRKPKLQRAAEQAAKELPGTPDWQPEAIDPFDARYKYPSDHEDEHKRKKLTPLGVLVELEKWQRSSKPRDIGDEMSLFKAVRECIAREAPDLMKENGHVQAPTEKARTQQQERAEAGEARDGGTEHDEPEPPPFDPD